MSTTNSKVSYHIPKERIHQHTLDNGMQILVYTDNSKPLVRLQLAYDIGSSIEQSFERGLAHLVEHMIFKGTQKASERDIDTIARKYGAELNAYTSYDVTTYYFQVDKANWKPFADILADSMQNSRFDEQHLASELRAVVQELNMGRDNHKRQLFLKAIEQAFPANHPYHFPVIGFKEQLANLTAKELKTFYNKYYHPSKATLFMAGDIDAQEAIAYATNLFKDIPNPEQSYQPEFPLVETNLTSIDYKMYEDVSQPECILFWNIPGEVEHQYLQVSTLAIKILGGDMNSRLYKRLVDEAQIAENISVFPCLLRQAGILLIQVQPKTDQLDACTQMIQEELQLIASNGINPIELQQKVNDEILNFLEDLESLDDVVNGWLDYFFATKDPLAYFKRVEELYKIQPEDITNFIVQFLIPDKYNRIQLLPLAEKDRPVWQKNKQLCMDQEAKILQNHQRTAPLEEPKLALLLPDPQDCPFDIPKLTHPVTKLNGLEVLSYLDTTKPVTKIIITFKDAEHLARSKYGVLVGLMLDMLLEGSQGFTKAEDLDFLDGLGANYNFSRSGIYLTTLENNFQAAFQRFMHIMRKPNFLPDLLEKAQAIYVRQMEGNKDEPKAIAGRLMWQKLYSGTEWDWDFDVAIDLIKKCTIQDIKALHEQYLNPSMLQMIVGGNFDYNQMQQMILDATSNWPTTEYVAQEIPTPAPKISGDVNFPMLRDQVFLRLIRPNTLNAYHPDLEALAIANFIGFYSLGSRIFNLREATGLFYTAGGGIAADAGKVASLDFITTIVNADKIELTESALLEVLDIMRTQGVTHDEFVAGKRLFFNDLVERYQTSDCILRRLLGLYSAQMPMDRDQMVWQRIQAMTLAELNAVIAKYFTTDNFVRIRVGNLMVNK